jgi:hypothetical protein
LLLPACVGWLPFYGGLHGLLAVGNLKDRPWLNWETVDSSEVYQDDWGNISYERDWHDFEKGVRYETGATNPPQKRLGYL